MKIIKLLAALAVFVGYTTAISFYDGSTFYVPAGNSVVRYSNNLQTRSSIDISAENQISTTYDGVIDRTNTFLFLFSGAGASWYITKVDIATFTFVQTITLERQPVAGSIMADNNFVYWLDNAPGFESTNWVRVGKNDAVANFEFITLNGSVIAVGPRPDPRAGSDINVDLVAYFQGPAGLLQRASTKTFTIIAPIPIPEAQKIFQVQNGIAYDIATNEAQQKVVSSYLFLTSALDPTGQSTVIAEPGQEVSALLEDRFIRGFLYTIVNAPGENRVCNRNQDNDLVKVNSFELVKSAGIVPRVDNGALHYTSGNEIYLYDVTTGEYVSAIIDESVPSPTDNISGDNNARTDNGAEKVVSIAGVIVAFVAALF